MQTKIWSPNI